MTLVQFSRQIQTVSSEEWSPADFCEPKFKNPSRNDPDPQGLCLAAWQPLRELPSSGYGWIVT
ncbi:MAG: hypothetical protein KDE31_07580, partial [Caldilineaceae bacterium]|nr:hypothetical protein [Caldilineaceae bacterium]